MRHPVAYTMFHLGREKRGDAGQSVPYIRENQPKVNVDNSKIFIFEGKIDPALKILTGNIPSSFLDTTGDFCPFFYSF